MSEQRKLGERWIKEWSDGGCTVYELTKDSVGGSSPSVVANHLRYADADLLCHGAARIAKNDTERSIDHDALRSIQVYCRSVNDIGLRGMIQEVLDNLPWLKEDYSRYVSDTETLVKTIAELDATTARIARLEAALRLAKDEIGRRQYVAGCVDDGCSPEWMRLTRLMSSINTALADRPDQRGGGE